jgi:5-methylcytosine-specific restriction endonuclease McrA
MQLPFQFATDGAYFSELLCQADETLAHYATLFDFRSPATKRAEFNHIKVHLTQQFQQHYGPICQLRYTPLCDSSYGLVLDHIIPLSTNVLNKKLRALTPQAGKKVVSQTFGSNHPDNLALACVGCNSHKKHKLLKREELQSIFARKRL